MGLTDFARRFFFGVFETQDKLEEGDTDRGIRLITVNGVCSMATGALQGGIFLSAFALAIGASNYEIGMLATIGFASQLLQIPGLYLVQKFAKRRGITVLCSSISRLLWVFILLIPILFVDQGVSFLLFWLGLASMSMAVCMPSWNSLLRDTVPSDRMGQVFSRRLALGTALGLTLTLVGGYFVGWWGERFPEQALYAYSMLFLLGLLFGLIEVVAIARVPERTLETGTDGSLFDLLSIPLKDGNFRHLLSFVSIWSFAVNMAGPFFIIYMLDRIHISLFWVTVLSMVSQLFNLLFLRIWGRLADRFSNKSVLSVSGPLFLLSILAWCFTTLPEPHAWTFSMLFVIHILGGISTAGVSLASTNIALKFSPHGKAHAYMTVFGLSAAIAGAIAPLVGGVIADFFAVRELSLSLNWSDPTRQMSVYALNFRALDFLFGFAFLLGLYSFNRLARVKEEGEVTEREVLESLVNAVVLPVRSFSPAAGFRTLASLPLQLFRKEDDEEPEK